MTEDEALQLSARHYVTCVLEGQMSPRVLAGWAHSTIGHEGPEWAQELVELDDDYDAFDGGWGHEPDWAQTFERLLIASAGVADKWNAPDREVGGQKGPSSGSRAVGRERPLHVQLAPISVTSTVLPSRNTIPIGAMNRTRSALLEVLGAD